VTPEKWNDVMGWAKLVEKGNNPIATCYTDLAIDTWLERLPDLYPDHKFSTSKTKQDDKWPLYCHKKEKNKGAK
jgi:hypothetical protein